VSNSINSFSNLLQDNFTKWWELLTFWTTKFEAYATGKIGSSIIARGWIFKGLLSLGSSLGWRTKYEEGDISTPLSLARTNPASLPADKGYSKSSCSFPLLSPSSSQKEEKMPRL